MLKNKTKNSTKKNRSTSVCSSDYDNNNSNEKRLWQIDWNFSDLYFYHDTDF